MSVEIRHLRSFLAVCDELHFGRAAQRLGVGQSAVSVNVRTLEESLGLTLVQRSSRQVCLTASGAAFEVPARAAVARFDGAVCLSHPSRHLSVGGTSHVRHRLSDALAQLRRAYPDAALVKREWGAAQLLAEVAAGRVDVGVAVEPDHHPDLAYRRIGEESLVVVMASAHPLATRDSISLGEIAGETILLQSDRRALGVNRMILDSCRLAGFAPIVAQGATDHDERFLLVRDGAGVEIRCADDVAGRREPHAAFVRVLPEVRLSVEAFWIQRDANPLVAALLEAARPSARR